MHKHLVLKQQASVLVEDLPDSISMGNISSADVSNYKPDEYQSHTRRSGLDVRI